MAGYLVRILCGLCIALLHVAAVAEELADPTRPPAALAEPVAGAVQKASEVPSGLQSIIISKTRRAAIIDGETVELGKRHGDARLIEVNEGSVVLQGTQGRQVLTLFPNVNISKKEIAATAQTSVSKVRAGSRKDKPAIQDEKLLTEPSAIPPGDQTTATKRPVMSGRPKEKK
jgi:MSHA biogenesis protein MshK